MTMDTLREVADFCRHESNDKADEGLPVLWQFLTKAHIAPDADPREWRAFVKGYEGQFADNLTLMGMNLWDSRDLTDEDIADANDD